MRNIMYCKRRFSFHALTALALAALCASCAQSPHSPVQETHVTTTEIKPYRLHTLEEFPQFTPQEMGQRVLALIDSIKSSNELTLERIQEVTGFPMERVSQSKIVDYSFTIHLPESGWVYGLDYREGKGTQGGGAWLDFSNEVDDKDIYHLPDMTPVCLDYYTYVAALERMGFEKTRDEHSDLGVIVATYYKRGDVIVQVTERREADQPEAKRNHACLAHISF
jgi:hypothetical protein